MASSIPVKSELYAALAAKFASRSAGAVKKRLIKMQWSGISKYKTGNGAKRRPKPLPKIPECAWSSDKEWTRPNPCRRPIWSSGDEKECPPSDVNTCIMDDEGVVDGRSVDDSDCADWRNS
ncbi:hypothetical protein T265_07144 [Opisthorchis viverrini]|uniref:Uncharacterized protein n=1 Tax=Opisthorchis viverrini TaxID=6198 RepID=A0A074ZPZ8_OPIVI|nr:hypothetical protein T265_07144 [Opisthorchis viverrini]KER25405.1 hypothetical protein T265_07144 [Opisthorchis viverrini]